MSFKVRLSNIGKIEKAELRIAPFTVFAGPNNTGKSFVSKLLYSLFDGVNGNPAEAYINTRLLFAAEHIRRLLFLKSNEEIKKYPLARLGREIAKLQEIAGQGMDPEGSAERFPALQKQVKSATEVARLLPDFEVVEAGQVYDVVENMFTTVKQELTRMNDELEPMDARQFVSAGLKERIHYSLMRVFQVPSLEDISGNDGDTAEVNVNHVGTLRLGKGERCFFAVPRNEHLPLREYSRIIYLESPVYWRLHRALEHADATPDIPDRQILSSVPGYFHDLVKAIKMEYTGEMTFADIHEKLTGRNGIGGKLVISELDDLLFSEGDRTYPISTTATGVANLGMLALLIERKVLDRRTLLFVDEPEAHLHPAWQVLMAEALFELSRQGVTVVMATQSSDIAKWLEVHIGKHPDDKQLIAVNRFPPREGDADADVENTLSRIKEDLLDTFAGLYIDAL